MGLAADSIVPASGTDLPNHPNHPNRPNYPNHPSCHTVRVTTSTKLIVGSVMVFMHVAAITTILTTAGARWAVAFGVLVLVIASVASCARKVEQLTIQLRPTFGRRPAGTAKAGCVAIGCFAVGQVSVARRRRRTDRLGKIGSRGGCVSIWRSLLGPISESFACSRRRDASQLRGVCPAPSGAVLVSIRSASRPASIGDRRLRSASVDGPSADERVPVPATAARATPPSRSKSPRPPDRLTRQWRRPTRLNFANRTGTLTVPFFFLGRHKFKCDLYRGDAETQRKWDGKRTGLTAHKRRSRQTNWSNLVLHIRLNSQNRWQAILSLSLSLSLSVPASRRFKRLLPNSDYPRPGRDSADRAAMVTATAARFEKMSVSVL